MSYSPGSLVSARGREWVVMPESTDDLLILRPLGGTDDETTGIYLPNGEAVKDASFAPPDPSHPGDFRSSLLLRQAVRLSIRAGAGPFRSLAAIAVEPRSYQLVPLLLALKQNPVRLLIADDVGIGKTVEAALIAKELLECGDAKGLVVLAPPHLAEQWQRELDEKFHIDTELVIASTAARLERACGLGESIFQRYQRTVVSIDFIKSERRRADFLRACPDLVIVDEAHTCTLGSEGKSRQLRHDLVSALASNAQRHIILVTATPHSGKEDAFRSLLRFLKPSFQELPEDLTGPENAVYRRQLAAHFVQRRRADIEHYLGDETPFPKRESTEETYDLTADHRRFFDRVLDFARETVHEAGPDKRRQRIRWWSALALLRAIGSSPSAAAQSLRNRTPTLDGESEFEVEVIGEDTVLDLDDAEHAGGHGVHTGADWSETANDQSNVRRRVLELAREAESFAGRADKKLHRLLELLDELTKAGHDPIVFCRFISTANYVADHTRKHLGKRATVDVVTGELAPTEREARVAELSKAARRVLICTDCLSEGINLQFGFDAVIHYDLAWNPTRHEQRDGRVDRYGQPRRSVKSILFYGRNNPVDGLILEVLLRKHEKIRTSLGISVPVPTDPKQVVAALLEALLLKEGSQGSQVQEWLPGFRPPELERLDRQWELAREREKRSRTMFAQESIKPEAVLPELSAIRAAAGYRKDVEAFVVAAILAHKGTVSPKSIGGGFEVHELDLREAPRALRDICGGYERIRARFEVPAPDGVSYLSRTHPLVSGLAAYVLDSALDSETSSVAARCGAIRTASLATRTTLLLVRERFHLMVRHEGGERALLAEECRPLAFTGSPDNPIWLSSEDAERLFGVTPSGNVTNDQARELVQKVTAALPTLASHLAVESTRRADVLLDAHLRVRDAAKLKGVRYSVKPKLPVDLLGIYVFLPVPVAPENSGTRS